MLSERAQRQVDRLLDQADLAIKGRDWAQVLACAQDVLDLDPDNADARTFLLAAQRAISRDPRGGEAASIEAAAAPGDGDATSSVGVRGQPAHPQAFCEGRYEVKRFLGEGGKKRVYLAHDAKLDRDVAFAIIKTDGLDEEGLLRIKREAQAMGRLGDHPHIVSVFDIGDESGQPYLVSQLMAGGDVEGLIEKADGHRIPVDVALKIADQVCQALDHAHTLGIVHRDLKPGNVWLMADGTAQLGDFGLAVALDRSRLTQAGMMVGTVSYMPPEQAMGGQVTPRSDLYSLGAMLYEMVTGRPPFVGDESVAIITQHLNTPPVSPSWHAPDLPVGLEALILRLLEKDPAKRPASAAEVRQMLGAALTPTPPPRLGEGRDDPATSPLPKLGEGPGVRAVPQTPPANPLYRHTFVGREAELQQVQRAFDAALSGQGSLVAVVGEPGIGKTALCEQIATYVAVRGGKTLVGHSYEEGSLSLPYLPFVEALRSYVLARDPEGLKQDLGSGAAEVARIVSEIRDRLPTQDSGLSTQHSSGPDDDRWRLYQALSGFLRNASNVQPLLVILEDLHWADRATLDLLVYLSRQLEGARILIVGNYRDVEVDRAHPLSGTLAELRRGSSFQRIPLRGLTADEVHRMLSALSGQDASWSLAEAVHRQTEGNPLFVQEVLRYLAEEGLVTREDGRWQRTGSTPLELQIPEGLRDVIGKRLSRLSPSCNQVLATAAVIGRDFELRTLQAVTGQDEEALSAALEEAEHVGVLEDQSRARVLRFRFAHAFFRQTLYEELFSARRLRLHQQVARALERQYASRPAEHASELAEHFAQSTDPEDLRKAVSYARLAAERALSVNAYGEAARLLEQAVQAQDVLDPDDAETRCDLLLALSEALMPGGEPKRAYEETAEQAFHLAEALGDAQRISRACAVAIESLHRSTGGFFGTPVYRLWAERADRHAAPMSRARVLADIALGSIDNSAGRNREERTHTVRALNLARQLGDRQALFEAGQRALRSTWWPELYAEQLALADELSTWPRDGVSTRPLGLVLIRSASFLLVAGERDRAEALWDELIEVAKRTGDAEASFWPIQIEAMRTLLDGDLESAFSAGDREIRHADEIGIVPHPSGLRALPLLYLGRAAEAFESMPRATSMHVERATSMHVACLAHAGQHEEARAELAHLLDPPAPLSRVDAAAVQLGLLLEGAVLTEDLGHAARLSRRLDGIAATTVGGQGVALHAVGRQLAAAAALLGDAAAARAHCARALDWATRIRYRPEIALSRLQIAELLLDEAARYQPSAISDGGTQEKLIADQMKAEAQGHLDFAIEEFRAMNMRPSLERALRHKGLLHA